MQHHHPIPGGGPGEGNEGGVPAPTADGVLRQFMDQLKDRKVREGWANLRARPVRDHALGLWEDVEDIFEQVGGIAAADPALVKRVRAVAGMSDVLAAPMPQAAAAQASDNPLAILEAEHLRVPWDFRVGPGPSIDVVKSINKDGDVKTDTIALGLAAPIARVVDDVGQFGYLVRYLVPGGNAYRQGVLMDADLVARTVLQVVARELPGMQVVAGQGTAFARWIQMLGGMSADELPTVNITRSTGWVGRVHATTPGLVSADVWLTPAGGAAAAAMQAIRPSGTWAGWLEGWDAAQLHPGPLLAIYASVAAALLHPAGQDDGGFVVEFAGQTSKGKTLSAVAGCSVWARWSSDFKLTWDSTETVVREMASDLLDLPLIVDEMQSIPVKSRPGILKRFVYGYSGGRSRQRMTNGGGTRDYQAEVGRRIRGVAITTGEVSILDAVDSGAQGLVPRVLSLPGHVLLARGHAPRDVGRAVAEKMRANAGHLGPMVVRAIEGAPWDALRRGLLNIVERMEDRDDLGNAASRMIPAAALIELAGRIVEKATGGRCAYNPIAVEAIFTSMLEAADQADRSGEAMLDALVDAMGAEVRNIYRHGQQAPGANSVDVFDFKTSHGRRWVGLTPARARRVLLEAGFTPKTALKQLRDEGLIETDPGRVTKKILAPWNSARANLVVLSEAVVADLYGVDEEPLPQCLDAPPPDDDDDDAIVF